MSSRPTSGLSVERMIYPSLTGIREIPGDNLIELSRKYHCGPRRAITGESSKPGGNSLIKPPGASLRKSENEQGARVTGRILATLTRLRLINCLNHAVGRGHCLVIFT